MFKKILFTLALIVTFQLAALAQSGVGKASDKAYSYAYIRVSGQPFSRKLVVDVDLGDTEAQKQAGQQYSDAITNKKSYAAVLNYMADEGYELVQMQELVESYKGTGGTSGVIFIMKKRKD